jgi:hypothetical protein
MATPAQIEANRRNAQRSTGPRTQAGKDKAKLNAIKHGLAASTSVFLPHEDAARYHEMRAALFETWQPANAQELLLVDQICQAWWATERSARFQNGFFTNQLRTIKARHRASQDPDANDDEGIAVSMSDPENEAGYRTLFRYDDRAWSKYHRAIDRLRKLQADRRKLERAAGNPEPEPEPQGEAVEQQEFTEELASFGETRYAPTSATIPAAASGALAGDATPPLRPLFSEDGKAVSSC